MLRDRTNKSFRKSKDEPVSRSDTAPPNWPRHEFSNEFNEDVMHGFDQIMLVMFRRVKEPKPKAVFYNWRGGTKGQSMVCLIETANQAINNFFPFHSTCSTKSLERFQS